MARRLFDIDIEGVKQVFEDLAEALDVLGFPKPLASWENQDDEDSKVRAWIASLESMEADEALAAVAEQFLAIERDLPKWAKEAGGNVAAGRNCIKQAREELAECCTYEDRD